MAKEFSSQTMEIMYQVIQFVKSEKYGIKIPLNNANECLRAMLGVSSRMIDNLKGELNEIQMAEDEERSSRRILRTRSTTITTVRKSSIFLKLNF